MALTPTQQHLLEALRKGSPKLLEVKNEPSPELLKSFENFDAFLTDIDHIPRKPRDRYIVVERKAVLTMLKYASDRNCLGLQYCYGLDKLITIGGQLQLINKGTIVDNPFLSEEYIYKSDFMVRGANGQWEEECFINFSPDDILPVATAGNYRTNFKSIYKLIPPANNLFLTGSLFPVIELTAVLNDPKTILGRSEHLTFRWGITNYTPNTELGDFILAVGVGDVTAGTVIERNVLINIFDPLSAGDCPPRPPC